MTFPGIEGHLLIFGELVQFYVIAASWTVCSPSSQRPDIRLLSNKSEGQAQRAWEHPLQNFTDEMKSTLSACDQKPHSPISNDFLGTHPY